MTVGLANGDDCPRSSSAPVDEKRDKTADRLCASDAALLNCTDKIHRYQQQIVARRSGPAARGQGAVVELHPGDNRLVAQRGEICIHDIIASQRANREQTERDEARAPSDQEGVVAGDDASVERGGEHGGARAAKCISVTSSRDAIACLDTSAKTHASAAHWRAERSAGARRAATVAIGQLPPCAKPRRESRLYSTHLTHAICWPRTRPAPPLATLAAPRQRDAPAAAYARKRRPPPLMTYWRQIEMPLFENCAVGARNQADAVGRRCSGRPVSPLPLLR
jgi:hypothetical protein